MIRGQPSANGPASGLRNSRKQSYHLIGMLTLLIISTSVQSIEAQSNCVTPERSAGQCVPYKECTHIVEKLVLYSSNLPKPFEEYIRRSRCESNTAQGFYICCAVNYGTGVRSKSPAVTSTTTKPMTTSGPISGPTSSPTERSPYIFTRSHKNFESSLDQAGVKLLNSFTCGVTETKRVSRGNNTRLGEFPWMALLRYEDPNKPFQCGGSLITDRFVLTATHCIKGPRRNVIGVRLGEHDIDSDIDCEARGARTFCAEPAEDFGVEATFVHPEYSAARASNDVGLVKLDRVVTFRKGIKPICLPLTKVAALIAKYPEFYYIAGWGRTDTAAQANLLQKARLPPRNISYCQAIFKNNPLNDLQICAGGDNSVDSCRGDSGGPLFAVVPYIMGGVRYVQYGVVSFGVEECGASGSYPGIYANVVQFMGWITKQILN